MTSGVAGNNLISIHAPARGATSMAAMGTTLGNGFQSTLPRGERLVKPCCLKYPFNFNPRSREGSDKRHSRNMFETIDFNPRSREGSDLHRFRHVLVVVGISIHAPARGATFGTLRSIPAASLFQSTLPRGERLLCGANLKLVIQFQSTLPRGERRNTQPRSAERRNFNPRSREGSDDAGAEACYIAAHFNPRSREGSD